MRNRIMVAVLFALWLGVVPIAADEPVDTEVNWRIRQEGTANSKILHTLHYLTDVYGPRLTGSPNLEAAARWAVEQLEEWGLQNGHLEAWDFGHPGWLNERLTAHIISPVKDHLVCEVLAWTPGTEGTVKGDVYQLRPPLRPTEEELSTYFDSVQDAVAGKIVLLGEHRLVPVTLAGSARRREESTLRADYNPEGNNPSTQVSPQRQSTSAETDVLSAREVTQRVARFLRSSGALVQVNDAGRDHGQIRAFSNRTYDPEQVLPTVIMRNEDFGRIARLLEHDAVALEFNIVNRWYPEGSTSYNAIAEIPGTDKADEVIMLGGHLDSWHAATGATDNGIGSAVMMEAARILQAIGSAPRRTIRVALWSGEEQGLLGSQAYVEKHFGTFEQPKPAYGKFGGYFNIDSGTGRVRAAQVFGPKEAADILRTALLPFQDLGVVGVRATVSRRRGGSDHTSFNEVGLPGIGMRQDPIQYGTYTWHTNLDTYERVIEADAIKSAISIAAAVYHLAMREELLPRLEGSDMPSRSGG